MDRLTFTAAMDIEIDLELHSRIVVVYGNSSTGKSYVRQMLNREVLNSKSSNEQDFYSTVKIFDYEHTDLTLIRDLNNAFIVIDNAELLFSLPENIDAVLYILGNHTNQYLIFSRIPLGLDIPVEDQAQLCFERDTFSLKYAKPVRVNAL